MTALIPLTAGLDDVIYWKIDVVTSHARRLEGSADDGKRFSTDGRCILIFIAKQRGEFAGGGLGIGPERRSADYCLVFFPVLCLVFFPGGALDRSF